MNVVTPGAVVAMTVPLPDAVLSLRETMYVSCAADCSLSVLACQLTVTVLTDGLVTVTTVGTVPISVDAAHAVQSGLGASDDTALTLLDDAKSLDADQLRRRARDLRDELDAKSVATREKEQRDLRSFKYWRRDDGADVCRRRSALARHGVGDRRVVAVSPTGPGHVDVASARR